MEGITMSDGFLVDWMSEFREKMGELLARGFETTQGSIRTEGYDQAYEVAQLLLGKVSDRELLATILDTVKANHWDD